MLKEKYNYVSVKNDSNEYITIKSQISLITNLIIYKKADSNLFMVITSIENKYYLCKENMLNNEFIPEKSFELTNNLDENKNGTYCIKNIDENIEVLINFNKGIITNNTIKINPNNLITNRGFCQRENGENFGQCNSREISEFCDDFIGTIAFSTNPGIAVLIAASCSC